jgi:hypothetical protein
MEEGPWIFRGYLLMMEEFDRTTPIPARLSRSVRVWVQIHKILLLYRIVEIVQKLVGKVRDVVMVEMKVMSSGGETSIGQG